ncbi:MoaD/ThiS family protein [Agromyces sp. MMS24-JH15]|uniref:MoaD/ThiS family protein n=1 Tax=Agromyces sp. MMS24-JH15 TaxID=3243765 RepID=UPI003749F1F4
MQLEIRYFAAVAAALGTDGEQLAVEPGETIDAVLGRLVSRVDPGRAAETRLSELLARCSFIVNGRSTRERGHALAPGDRLDVLPPFAGG